MDKREGWRKVLYLPKGTCLLGRHAPSCRGPYWEGGGGPDCDVPSYLGTYLIVQKLPTLLSQQTD